MKCKNSDCDCHEILIPGLHCSICDPTRWVERINRIKQILGMPVNV